MLLVLRTTRQENDCIWAHSFFDEPITCPQPDCGYGVGIEFDTLWTSSRCCIVLVLLLHVVKSSGDCFSCVLVRPTRTLFPFTVTHCTHHTLRNISCRSLTWRRHLEHRSLASARLPTRVASTLARSIKSRTPTNTSTRPKWGM